MQTIQQKYQDTLLCSFDATLAKEGTPIFVVTTDTCIESEENVHIVHYEEDFESLLTCKIPTKMRNTKQLITKQACEELIKKIAYGILSFTYHEVPYSVALNHVYNDGKLYFHAAKTGFKLHACATPVSYLVIKDLGINEEMSTHNHQSVFIQGTMHMVEDVQEKGQVLKQLMAERAPSNKKPITEAMSNAVSILALDIQFMIGKSHIR